MYIDREGIIVAPATIPGTGAVSIVRISGKGCLELVDKVVRFSRGDATSSPGGRIKFGRIYSGDELVDEVLVAVFRAPHSYTGEDSAEISCHASKYIVEEILRLLCACGAKEAGPGEFTERSFLNGKMDLAQAEAVADLISASGKASHKVAMDHLRGGYSNKLNELRKSLVEIAALLELELDFSDEDVEFADRERLKTLIEETLAHISSLMESFKAGNALKNGIPVAIVGPVNAGKSTLLNTLLGEDRSIVSTVAGTTRDTVEESLTLGGLPFRFIDTAGIRESSDEIEKMGIDRTFRKLSEASIILGILDGSADEKSLSEAFEEIVSHCDFETQKLVILPNKMDILAGNKNVITINNIVFSIDFQKNIPVIPISAKNGDGISELKDLLVKIGADFVDVEGETVVTNLRHYNALASSKDALKRVLRGLGFSLSPDLLAQDLRLALWHIGSITGEVSSDEILGEIFSRFCIGK
ncbi:MAG: tRNA uridine-5-carboxymethylaminomethyl(34) synthesis GTPase MnmE [Bacteroidales bacterium]|nr:tRNA uridine-5-carboxymethylaminomethyl(34) synthesis GTPase MnmE [Bacteroidales bacterium]